VVDADALNLLAHAPQRRDDWILTPHPGEAARLLQSSNVDVQANRFAAIAELQARYGGTVALKGSGALILGPSNRPPALCSDGNPGMASGGMGDLLTGLIASFLAQGLDFEAAASMGVCLHAAAADQAAQERGERGLLATDLLGYLGCLMKTGPMNGDISC
jgi:NAD(P)H-hydrate epimerase